MIPIAIVPASIGGYSSEWSDDWEGTSETTTVVVGGTGELLRFSNRVRVHPRHRPVSAVPAGSLSHPRSRVMASTSRR